MKSFFEFVWIWLRGRKTYIVALIVFLVVASLVFLGRLTPATALVVLMFALPAFAATFRAAIETHSREIQMLLFEIAEAGVDASRHNATGAAKVGLQIAEDAARLANEIHSEEKAQ